MIDPSCPECRRFTGGCSHHAMFSFVLTPTLYWPPPSWNLPWWWNVSPSPPNVPVGWSCPKCGAVYAPGVLECRRCVPTSGQKESTNG